MIQGTTETTFKAYVCTEDNRIDTTAPTTKVRHLIKITNDMSGAIAYCYPAETINNRYTEFTFTYALNPDMFLGEIDLKPAGYYKYEVYEVVWLGTVTVTGSTAPATETDVLAVDPNNGIVKGLVTKGKWYQSDKAGTAQVQYTQHPEPTGSNYIWYGDSGFENAFSLDFDGVDDYVDCGDAPIFTINQSGANRGFSSSFWVKLTTGAINGQIFLNKSDFFSGGGFRFEYRIQSNFAGKPRIQIYGGDSSSIYQILDIDTVLAADTWYHIGFTYNLGSTSTSLVGYLDGVRKTNGNGATYSSLGTWSAPVNTAAPLYFAKQAANYGQIKLDEVALFDDIVSAGKMDSFYNNGNPTNIASEDNIIAYWRNGDPSGTASFPTIDDLTTFDNNGTMTNMSSDDIINDAP